MQFNKLYNLILLSIISLNSAYRKKLILNTTYSPGLKSWILRYLDHIGDNKTADLIARFFANHLITGFMDADDSLNRVKKIVKLNPSIDTQNFKGTLKEFLETYLPTIQKTLQKQISKTIAHLDSIPEFYDKEEPEEGIVIYRVKDTKEGMHAVRKVVDKQWGRASNPWCLIARKGEKDLGLLEAWKFWSRYDKFPKQIAFQNGKLLAMCASARKKTWWDLDDRIMSQDGLLRVNGKLIQTKDVHMYTKYEKLKIAFENFKKQLIYNPETKKWDSKTSLILYKTIETPDGDEDVPISKLLVKNGKLTIPFGKIVGAFDCSCCNLKTLLNCPEYVVGLFICEHNLIKDLVGGPKKVGGDYDVLNNYNLRSFKGKPEYLGGKIHGTPLTEQPYFTKGWKDFDDAWKDLLERS